MTRAVVFAYHNVGVRCLRVLFAHGVEVPLVVTHDDNPREQIWFASVARTAAEYGVPAVSPADPNAAEFAGRVTALAPDFVFSFYYRTMLKAPLLRIAPRGALNMHGSLLPRYRGRAPVNWAVLFGERETGATLHYMTEKPDAGDVVAQTAVPILPDDTAREVFDKVTLAAEMTLDRVLPALVAGTAPRLPQDLARGSYFGGRTPEDGTIDWNRDAATIHNLVRAVAPPYPGALTTIARARRAGAADATRRSGDAAHARAGARGARRTSARALRRRRNAARAVARGRRRRGRSGRVHAEVRRSARGARRGPPMSAKSAPPGGGFGTTRIEALADGIFAVAMTLLVLDVKLPNGEHFATSGALLDRLLSLEHTFVIYFISFVVLGMFWVGHHAHFHYIRYVDHTLLWINLLFLFGITSVPFATDLLGDHNGIRLPYFYYGGKLLVLAGLLIAQIAYLGAIRSSRCRR